MVWQFPGGTRAGSRGGFVEAPLGSQRGFLRGSPRGSPRGLRGSPRGLRASFRGVSAGSPGFSGGLRAKVAHKTLESTVTCTRHHMHRNPMFFHSKCSRGVCQGDRRAPRDVCCSFLEKRLCSLPLKLKKRKRRVRGGVCKPACVFCRVWRSCSRILQAVTRPGEQAPEPRVIWLVAT